MRRRTRRRRSKGREDEAEQEEEEQEKEKDEEERAGAGAGAGRFGDAYAHETVISHIRRGLDHRFPRSPPGETRAKFARRIAKVQE